MYRFKQWKKARQRQNGYQEIYTESVSQGGRGRYDQVWYG